MSNARNLARLLPNASGQLPDAAMSSGSVLQVVQAQLAQTFCSTSSSFVDTGLSLSITPLRSNSRILLIVTGGGNDYYGVGSLGLTIYRDGANIAPSGDFFTSDALGTGNNRPASFSHLDYPNTISPITYSVRQRNVGATTNICFNYGSRVATLLALEVAQ